MLVVAIVATVATYLSFRQQVWLRQVQNTTDRATVESVRQGALAFAGVVLDEDLKQNNFDHLKEKWAQPVILPFDGGTVAIAITDAQARFNLNSLQVGGSAPPQSGQPPANPSNPEMVGQITQAFAQLLVALKIDPGLANALKDWIDPDTNTLPGGAEDLEYATLSVPYRAANQLLISVDELRLIKGFTKEIVETLRPFVIALPGPAPINANTASETVLATLFSGGGDTAAKDIVRARDAKPFESITDYDKALPQGVQKWSNLTPSTASSYFLVNVDIRVGRLSSQTEGLIKREGNRKTTVYWSRPRPIVIQNEEPG